VPRELALPCYVFTLRMIGIFVVAVLCVKYYSRESKWNVA